MAKIIDNRTYATGRRKTSVARVFLAPKGSGEFSVNGKKVSEYFPDFFLQRILDVFTVIGSNNFDVYCTVKGGGVTGQAEAVRHGLARALSILDRDMFRLPLKTRGYLTRDDRMVERKKYGLRKSRKREQYSKR